MMKDLIALLPPMIIIILFRIYIERSAIKECNCHMIVQNDLFIFRSFRYIRMLGLYLIMNSINTKLMIDKDAITYISTFKKVTTIQFSDIVDVTIKDLSNSMILLDKNGVKVKITEAYMGYKYLLDELEKKLSTKFQSMIKAFRVKSIFIDLDKERKTRRSWIIGG